MASRSAICPVRIPDRKRCTPEMIAAAPKLRLIQKIGVGVNTIDLDAEKAHGIPVCNLPGTNSRSEALHAGDDRGGAEAAADPEDWCRCQHDRPRRGEGAWHPGLQSARYEFQIGSAARRR